MDLLSNTELHFFGFLDKGYQEEWVIFIVGLRI